MRAQRLAGLALLGGAIGAATGSHAEPALSVRNGFEAIFALRPAGGAALRPGPARVGTAGSAQPKPGEVSIGLSTTQAVGAPKIHVYNEYPKVVQFTFTAMDGAKVLATEDLCGHRDTDSWTVLPENTSRVVLWHFVARDGDCP